METDNYSQNFQRVKGVEGGGGHNTTPHKDFQPGGGYYPEQHVELEPCL